MIYSDYYIPYNEETLGNQNLSCCLKKTPDSASQYCCILRLYGSVAFAASTGLSRVTRGSVIFLSQCCSKPDRTGQTTDRNNVIEGEKSCKNLYSGTTGDHCGSVMKRTLILKLHPITGSMRRLIVDDRDCAVQGLCRGAYPRLFGLADHLSQWCKTCPSILLSRCIIGCDLCHGGELKYFEHDGYCSVLCYLKNRIAAL